MDLKKTMMVTVAVLWVGLPVGMSCFVEAADSGGTSQSDKSRQPGLPDPGMKQTPPPTANPTNPRNSDPLGKAPTGPPGGPGPTAPGSGGGMGSSGGSSSSGGAGGAAGGGGGR